MCHPESPCATPDTHQPQKSTPDKCIHLSALAAEGQKSWPSTLTGNGQAAAGACRSIPYPFASFICSCTVFACPFSGAISSSSKICVKTVHAHWLRGLSHLFHAALKCPSISMIALGDTQQSNCWRIISTKKDTNKASASACGHAGKKGSSLIAMSALAHLGQGKNEF